MYRERLVNPGSSDMASAAPSTVEALYHLTLKAFTQNSSFHSWVTPMKKMKLRQASNAGTDSNPGHGLGSPHIPHFAGTAHQELPNMEFSLEERKDCKHQATFMPCVRSPSAPTQVASV